MEQVWGRRQYGLTKTNGSRLRSQFNVNEHGHCKCMFTYHTLPSLGLVVTTGAYIRYKTSTQHLPPQT